MSTTDPVNMSEQHLQTPISPQQRLQALAMSNLAYQNGNNNIQPFHRNLDQNNNQIQNNQFTFSEQYSQQQSGEINPNQESFANNQENLSISNLPPIPEQKTFQQPNFGNLQTKLQINEISNQPQIESKPQITSPNLPVPKVELKEPIIAKNEVKPFERKTEKPRNKIMNFFRNLRPDHHENGKHPSLKNLNRPGNWKIIQANLDRLRETSEIHN